MSNRIEKVNSLLEHELSKIIQREFIFPENSIVTLTHVDTIPNLIEAKVYISVFPEEKTEEALRILNKDIYSVQQEINKKLNMRPIPKIRFLRDEIISHASKIEELLQDIKEKESN